MGTWESTELPGSGGEPLRVTGVPAQHGPAGSDELVGEVTGFALSRRGSPALYISGDNASIQVVRRIRERLGPFARAILFAGAARTALAGGAPLTLTSERAAKAADILGRPTTVTLHFEGWAHPSEGADELRTAFERESGHETHLPPGKPAVWLRCVAADEKAPSGPADGSALLAVRAEALTCPSPR